MMLVGRMETLLGKHRVVAIIWARERSFRWLAFCVGYVDVWCALCIVVLIKQKYALQTRRAAFDGCAAAVSVCIEATGHFRSACAD